MIDHCALAALVSSSSYVRSHTVTHTCATEEAIISTSRKNAPMSIGSRERLGNWMRARSTRRSEEEEIRRSKQSRKIVLDYERRVPLTLDSMIFEPALQRVAIRGDLRAYFGCTCHYHLLLLSEFICALSTRGRKYWRIVSLEAN